MTQLTCTCSKSSNIKNRKRFEICSKLTIKTTGRRQRRCSDVITVNFEHILHLFLLFILFDSEQLNVSWRVRETVTALDFFSKLFQKFLTLLDHHQENKLFAHWLSSTFVCTNGVNFDPKGGAINTKYHILSLKLQELYNRSINDVVLVFLF